MIDTKTLLKEHNHEFLHRLLNLVAFQSHWMATFHSLLSSDDDLKHLDGPKSQNDINTKYNPKWQKMAYQDLTRLLLAECELEVLSWWWISCWAWACCCCVGWCCLGVKVMWVVPFSFTWIFFSFIQNYKNLIFYPKISISQQAFIWVYPNNDFRNFVRVKIV